MFCSSLIKPWQFSDRPLFISVSTGSVVSGAGAFEVAVADGLVKHKPNVKGRAQLGVQAFADALLVIPKVRDSFFSVLFKLLCITTVNMSNLSPDHTKPYFCYFNSVSFL